MSIFQGSPTQHHAFESKDILSRYELLEQCILSQQMTENEVITLLRADTVFAEWLNKRIANRLSA